MRRFFEVCVVLLMLVGVMAGPTTARTGSIVATTGSTAFGGTVTPPPAEIPPTDTDYSQTVGVAQFDPALGTLDSVTVELAAAVIGSMGVENTSVTSGSMGDIELSAAVAVGLASDPTSDIAVASPAVAETFDLPVFDGIVDFAGTSGVIFADIAEVRVVTAILTDAPILAAATGTGTFDLIVHAVGTSFASTTGGTIAWFVASQAGATITVTYDYQSSAEPMPAVDLEKFTNGDDADEPAGPSIVVGQPVTWEYGVANTGDVALSAVIVTDDQGVAVTCPQDTLAVGESMSCTATGTAVLGQYANVGTVTGIAPDGSMVTDSDPSHYLGVPAEPVNVALGADVTLRGDAFFTAGWGQGLIVPAGSVVDGVFLPRGTQWDQGAVWWDQYDGRSAQVIVDFGRQCRIDGLVVQADDNDTYSVRYESHRGWRAVWLVPNYDLLGTGMQTRPEPADDAAVHVLRRPVVTSRLLVEAMPRASNDLYFSVSEIQAFGSCFDGESGD